jgi:hypothetical protein
VEPAAGLWDTARVQKIADAAVPLVSVLIGALITYWLNVREKRRSKVADIFHEAIAAVAMAVAAHDYITQVPPWLGCTPDAHKAFTAELGRAGNAGYIEAVAQARAAVARASAYDPSLRDFYRDTTAAIYERGDELMAKLHEDVARTRRGRVRPQ